MVWKASDEKKKKNNKKLTNKRKTKTKGKNTVCEWKREGKCREIQEM